MNNIKSKLLKKSKRNTLGYNSKTKKTKKNNKNNKTKNLLVNILYNTKNPDEIVDKLRNFYKTYIDNEKFLKYEKEFVSFDKSIQGKSGSIVGYLKNNPKLVLKIHYFKTNLNKLIYYDKCIQFNNKFNEIFMNILFKNIKYLPNFSISEKNEVKKYILEIKDYGFSDNSFYIINPLIGINYIDKSNKKYFITNLRDIMNINHSLFLKKDLNVKNMKIIELYD